MDTIKTSKPKARKAHKCNFCGGVIEKGEIYNSQTNVYDGSMYVWKSHIKCGEIAYVLRMYDDADEGVTSEDFSEFINNEFCEIFKETPIDNSKAFLVRLDSVISFYENLKELAPKISSKEREFILHTCGLDNSHHQYRNRYILPADECVSATVKTLIELDLLSIASEPKNTAYLTVKGLKLAYQLKYKLWL